MSKPQVIIVGGGMAGLSAAHRLLHSQGFSPHKLNILEASDRFGGRIHTISFGRPSDRVVELGANWIHGGVPANPVYTIAAEHGLLTVCWLLFVLCCGSFIVFTGMKLLKWLHLTRLHNGLGFH